MSLAANQPLAPGATRSNGLLKAWLPLAFFAILWADLIRQLGYTWEADEQYAFGWFVPIFALGLFWRRWLTRPRPEPAPFCFPLSAVCFLLLLFMLPLRVVYEINPDWPLCSWAMALAVVVISLYAVYLAGGWKWIRYFAFPVCFILVAVQWPYRIEHALTQGLMRVVAGVTVELLGWFDMPAFQHGNLIEVSTGTVGVSEACSGIRSFQSSLMAALLMGELYRLRLLPRATLVVCGLTLAFCFNVVRASFLTWQTNAHGMAAIDKWHDPAGMTIAVACFFALWAIALLLKCKWSASSFPSPLRLDRGEGQGEVSPSSAGFQQPVVPKQGEGGSAFSHQPAFSGRYLLAVGCWAILCVAATEVWYRSHENQHASGVRWSVGLPVKSPGFKAVPMAPKTREMLKADATQTGSWPESDGSQWTVYSLRWNPNSMQSVIRARLHSPEICLSAAGLRQISKSGLDYFATGPLQIPFHKYIFEAGGQRLFVFFSLWQDGEEQTGMRQLNQSDRIRWVLAGRRGMGQQTLEIICTGYPDMAAAEKAVRERLPKLIKIENTRSVMNSQ